MAAGATAGPGVPQPAPQPTEWVKHAPKIIPTMSKCCKLGIGFVATVALTAIALGSLALYSQQMDFFSLGQNGAIGMIAGGVGALVVIVGGTMYYNSAYLKPKPPVALFKYRMATGEAQLEDLPTMTAHEMNSAGTDLQPMQLFVCLEESTQRMYILDKSAHGRVGRLPYDSAVVSSKIKELERHGYQRVIVTKA